MAIKTIAKHEPYRRCGVPHTIAGTIFANDVFTHRELEQLRTDPHLTLVCNYEPKAGEDVIETWHRDRLLTPEQRGRLDDERTADALHAASGAALTIENEKAAAASYSEALANAAASLLEDAAASLTEPKPATAATDETKPTDGDAGNGAPPARAVPGAKPAEAKPKSGNKPGQAAK